MRKDLQISADFLALHKKVQYQTSLRNIKQNKSAFCLLNIVFRLYFSFIMFNFHKTELIFRRVNFSSRQKDVLYNCSIAFFKIIGATLSSSFPPSLFAQFFSR